MMGVPQPATLHDARNPRKDPTVADEKPVDASRQTSVSCHRVQGTTDLQRLGWTLCTRSRSSAGEVDYVAAKRMVKYFYGTRDIGLELRPRKDPLRLDAEGGRRRGILLGSNGVVRW